MLSSLLSFLGWSYLPDLITRQLLPYFHKFYATVLHRPPPDPKTSLYRLHYRCVYAFTVFSYLLHNFYHAARSIEPNYYELLGVDPTADENALKMAFRQFARKNHPDRVGSQGEARFIGMRDAFEALKNPVTRFAYDRFGTEAISWQHCTTPREYIRYGLMQSSGFYIVGACFLLLVSAVGRPSNIAFWRYLLFVAVFAYEFKLITSPSASIPASMSSAFFEHPASLNYTSLFALIWPQRVAYQHIRFLHSLLVFVSVALSRVAPVVFPPSTDTHADPKKLTEELTKISYMSQLIDANQKTQLLTDLFSVQIGGSTSATSSLPSDQQIPSNTIDLITKQMENMIIESQLRDGGPLQSAVDTAVKKKKKQAALEQQKRMTKTGMPSPTPSPPAPQALRLPERNPSRRGQPVAGSSMGREEQDAGYIRGRSRSW